MRKIEREMVDAVNAHRNWKSGNTEVLATKNGVAMVYLHNNHIATVYGADITINQDTFKDWPTRTTKSRLRALGANI